MLIKVSNLSKVYRRGKLEVLALDNINLGIEAGQFVSIMGPSGSGKSTLLHLLGGLDVPSSGEVLFEGENLAKMSDNQLSAFRRAKLGFVFQFFNLMPTLTAEENVALPLLLMKKNRNVVQEEVNKVFEIVGLSHRKGHMPDELSGGEMQRVSIARALINKPRLLLADEPTGSLDSKSGEEILSILREATDSLNMSVIMVTHDPKAAAYGDRIITLKDGRLADILEVGR